MQRNFMKTCQKIVDNYFYPDAVQPYKTKADVLEYLQYAIKIFEDNQLDTSLLQALVEKLQA
jgi:protein associated with RNAse G/E